MSKTINGKSIKEIFAELEAPLPESAIEIRDYDKMPYISIDTYRQRIDEVLGRDHYNELYTEPNIERIKNTYGITVICKLEILDDDYNVIIRKECAGGKDISFANLTEPDSKDSKKVTYRYDEDGEKITAKTALAFGNDIACACQEAFKNICKRLNIGTTQLEAAKEEKERRARGTEYTITFTKDTNYGEKGMFCDISCKEAPDYKRLALFASDMKKIKAIHPEGYKKEETICILATKGTDNRNNPQLVFKDIIKKVPAVSEVSSATKSKSEAPTENGVIVKTVTTTSAVTEYSSAKGNFSVQAADENGEAFTVYISSDAIKLMSEEYWSKFVVQCAKKSVTFTMECVRTEKNGKPHLCMKNFSK